MKKIRLFVIPSNLKSDNVVVFYYGRGVKLGAYAPNFSPATPFAQQGMLFYFSFCRPAYPMKTLGFACGFSMAMRQKENEKSPLHPSKSTKEKAQYFFEDGRELVSAL